MIGRPRRVLLAPDKFKGTFTAREVCEHLATGLREAGAEIEVVAHPMADGGDGTLDVLESALGGARRSVEAAGPFGEPRTVDLLELGPGRVVLESALVCGLALVPPKQRDPMRTTSRGVGDLLRDAFRRGTPEVWVGLGGTATTDGGLGAARALGFRLLDGEGRELDGTGRDLVRIERLVPPREWPATGARVIGLCDVRNPLFGPQGAAWVFGPQKGAILEDVRRLDEGLQRLSRLLERTTGIAVSDLPGCGAAGGLPAMLAALLRAELLPGAAFIGEATGLSSRIEGAGLVITGEGIWQPRRHPGKVVDEVITRCRARGVPVVVICGRAEGGPVDSGVHLLATGGPIEAQDFRKFGKALAAQDFSGG